MGANQTSAAFPGRGSRGSACAIFSCSTSGTSGYLSRSFHASARRTWPLPTAGLPSPWDLSHADGHAWGLTEKPESTRYLLVIYHEWPCGTVFNRYIIYIYMCVYICLYIYIYTYIHIYIYTYMHIYMCTYIHIYMCTYIHIYICVYIPFKKIYLHIYIYVAVCMHVCTYVCVHACMSIYIYVCVCIYIYTYTYVYTRISALEWTYLFPIPAKHT